MLSDLLAETALSAMNVAEALGNIWVETKIYLVFFVISSVYLYVAWTLRVPVGPLEISMIIIWILTAITGTQDSHWQADQS